MNNLSVAPATVESSYPKTRRVGKFLVHVPHSGDDESRWGILRLAQEGCAILRCEYMFAMDAFEIVAIHEDFEPNPIAVEAPLYWCEFTDHANGSTTRRFVKA